MIVAEKGGVAVSFMDDLNASETPFLTLFLKYTNHFWRKLQLRLALKCRYFASSKKEYKT